MIKFLDLHSQQILIKGNLMHAIKKVLSHGNFILGKEVIQLEKKLTEYSGAKNCITCANGTDALTLCLMALDIKPNDVVFAPSFTYVSTVEAIKSLGAKVCFIDVELDSFNISCEKLVTSIEYVRNKLNFRPKCIISVDLFGQPANYEQLNKISQKYNISVIADSAQSFGAKQKNKRVGNLTKLSTTSFFPAKPLGCYGDGGAIFSNNEKISKKIKSLRNHGQGKDKYNNIRIGMNSRLDTIQAAILIEKLKIFKKEIQLRNNTAEYYNKNLSTKVKVPEVNKNNLSVWAQYTIKVKKKKRTY